MSSINPLGRLFNLSRTASGGNVRHNLRDASGALFLVDTPANASTLTIKEANASSGGTIQNLAAVTEYYTSTSGVWTRVTQAAGAVVTVSGTPDLLAVWVPQGALSDGFAYITADHSAKATEVVLADLDVQRKPANLRDVRA
jgi:hypothetical protein